MKPYMHDAPPEDPNFGLDEELKPIGFGVYKKKPGVFSISGSAKGKKIYIGTTRDVLDGYIRYDLRMIQELGPRRALEAGLNVQLGLHEEPSVMEKLEGLEIPKIEKKPRRQRDKRSELQQLGLISGQPLEDEGEGEEDGMEEDEEGQVSESEATELDENAKPSTAPQPAPTTVTPLPSERDRPPLLDSRPHKRSRILSVPDASSPHAQSPALGSAHAPPPPAVPQALHLYPSNAAVSALTHMADATVKETHSDNPGSTGDSTTLQAQDEVRNQ